MSRTSRALASAGVLLLLFTSLFAISAASHSQRQIPDAPPPTLSSSPSAGDLRKIYFSRIFAKNAETGATTGRENGSAILVVDGDRFGVVLEGAGLTPGIPVLAHIHRGSTCPTPAQDTNQDGFVDPIEAETISGGILIPFNQDLTFSGNSFTPSTDSRGNLIYIQSNSLTSVLPEPFDLAQTVIEIHGIHPGIPLPPSVQSLPGYTANESLPVACGAVTQIAGPMG